jgi:hypothetical protein
MSETFPSSRRALAHGGARRWIAGLAVCFVFVLTDAAAARHGMAASGCAGLDGRIVALLQDHDEAQDLSAEELSDASLAIVRARRACADGRSAEAMALFDSLFLVGPLAGH